MRTRMAVPQLLQSGHCCVTASILAEGESTSSACFKWPAAILRSWATLSITLILAPIPVISASKLFYDLRSQHFARREVAIGNGLRNPGIIKS
jgi:hypothetical protein